MTDLAQQKLALEELRHSYDIVSKSSDALDQKAGSLLSNAGLITALYGALQIARPSAESSSPYWFGIILVLVAFLALVALCTSLFWPRAYKIPIQADWDIIDTQILQQKPAVAIEKVISSYTTYIPLNRKLNSSKATRIRIASFLFFGLVTLTIVLSFASAS